MPKHGLSARCVGATGALSLSRTPAAPLTPKLAALPCRAQIGDDATPLVDWVEAAGSPCKGIKPSAATAIDKKATVSMQPLTVRARARVVSLNDRCFLLAHHRAPSRVRPPRPPPPRYRICASQTHGACADTTASAAPDAALAENPGLPYKRHEGRKMKRVRFFVSHKVRMASSRSRPSVCRMHAHAIRRS